MSLGNGSSLVCYLLSWVLLVNSFLSLFHHDPNRDRTYGKESEEPNDAWLRKIRTPFNNSLIPFACFGALDQRESPLPQESSGFFQFRLEKLCIQFPRRHRFLDGQCGSGADRLAHDRRGPHDSRGRLPRTRSRPSGMSFCQT